MSRSPRASAPAPSPDIEKLLPRLGDGALLAMLSKAIAVARDRRLDAALVEILGETLREMLIEQQSRQARDGEPNLYEALPIVHEAKAGACSS